jgi:hypothetical protein
MLRELLFHCRITLLSLPHYFLFTFYIAALSSLHRLSNIAHLHSFCNDHYSILSGSMLCLWDLRNCNTSLPHLFNLYVTLTSLFEIGGMLCLWDLSKSVEFPQFETTVVGGSEESAGKKKEKKAHSFGVAALNKVIESRKRVSASRILMHLFISHFCPFSSCPLSATLFCLLLVRFRPHLFVFIRCSLLSVRFPPKCARLAVFCPLRTAFGPLFTRLSVHLCSSLPVTFIPYRFLLDFPRHCL